MEEEVPESKPSVLNKEELGWSKIIEKDLNNSLSEQYRNNLILHPDKTHTLSLQSVDYKNDLDRQFGNKTGKMMNKDGIVMDEVEIDKVRGIDRPGKSLH